MIGENLRPQFTLSKSDAFLCSACSLPQLRTHTSVSVPLTKETADLCSCCRGALGRFFQGDRLQCSGPPELSFYRIRFCEQGQGLAFGHCFTTYSVPVKVTHTRINPRKISSFGRPVMHGCYPRGDDKKMVNVLHTSWSRSPIRHQQVPCSYQGIVSWRFIHVARVETE